MKLQKNDNIIVLTGNDKGKTGVISSINPQKQTAKVDGINQYKKHLKKTSNQEGGIVTLSRPIHISKIALVCPNCKQKTRISYSGTHKEKVRVCKKCQKPIIKEANKK